MAISHKSLQRDITFPSPIDFVGLAFGSLSSNIFKRPVSFQLLAHIYSYSLWKILLDGMVRVTTALLMDITTIV